MARVKRYMVRGVVFLVLAFLLIQFIPYGWHHTNPPLRDAPVWPSQEIEHLARRACYDCHSHETNWPWYASVAPMSWVVTADVEKGRARLNFSDWTRSSKPAHDRLKAMILGKHMPPPMYIRAHPEADLSDSERDRLADALERLSDENEGKRRRRGGDRDGTASVVDEKEEGESGRRRGGRSRERTEAVIDEPKSPSPVGTVPSETTSNLAAETPSQAPDAPLTGAAKTATSDEHSAETPSTRLGAEPAEGSGSTVVSERSGNAEAVLRPTGDAAFPPTGAVVRDAEALEEADGDIEEAEEADEEGEEASGRGRGRGRRRGGRGDEIRVEVAEPRIVVPTGTVIEGPEIRTSRPFVGPPPLPAPPPRIIEQRPIPRPVEVEEESGRGRGRGRNRGGRGGGRDH